MPHRLPGALLPLALLAQAGFAGYVQRKPMEVRQPDGSTLSVVVTGDEFHARIESPEGHTLVRDPASGGYHLARYNPATGKLESRGIPYSPSASREVMEASKGVDLPKEKIRELRLRGREERMGGRRPAPAPTARPAQSADGPVTARSLSAGPATVATTAAAAAPVNDTHVGDILGLTLLVDFPDDGWQYAPVFLDSLINGGPGFTWQQLEATNYAYWHSVSGCKLRYKNVVMDHWYRAPQPKAHYRDQANMRALVNEVLQHLEDRGFDFSRLTTRSNGEVRAVNLVYHGLSDPGTALWPGFYRGEGEPFRADGVWLSRYAVIGLERDFPYMGTFIHENGHQVMGWADMYDPDGGGAGLGPYCLMGWENRERPQRPNPHFRLQAGWDQVIDINSAPAGTRLTLGSMESKVFRYRNPANPQEFFLIDARPARGRHWPHAHGGLAIWHVDNVVENNDKEAMTADAHYYVSLEQSNGLFNLERGLGQSDQDIFFHSGTQRAFHDGTLPNARWWNGDESGLSLAGITAEPTAQGAISFEIANRPVLPTHTVRVTTAAPAQVIALPAPCNLPRGATGASPAGSGNFGTVPRVGDRLYLNADGSSRAVTLASASAWWLGFPSTPYQGADSTNGACSVIRGGVSNGRVAPASPFTTTRGRTQTFQFYPNAGYVVSDVKVDGVSVGARYSHTLHNIDRDHAITVGFAPGTLTYNLTVNGENGPGTYTGSGTHPAATWVPISATPAAGYAFDHWHLSWGTATIENPRSSSTRVSLDRDAVVLARYVAAPATCGGAPAYQDGATYATGAVVANLGSRYSCLVGGWCSQGGAYAPGQGWAWRDAWKLEGECQ